MIGSSRPIPIPLSIVVENLKVHLVQIPNAPTIPQLVGHKLYLPHYKRCSSTSTTIKSMGPRAYHELQKKPDRGMYANGGGYAMNQNFFDKLARLIVHEDPTHCFPEKKSELPEDFVMVACIASYYPLSPLLARDAQARLGLVSYLSSL
jgi:hypothetical protein